MNTFFTTHMPRLLVVAILVLPAFASTAKAAYYHDFHSPFDFSLTLAKNDVDLQSENNKHLASLDRISIKVFTLIEPRVQFGFITGSSSLSLDNEPTTAGMNLNGYHAGLALRSSLGSNPQIGIHANYLYQKTKNETTTQAVNLSWHEWTAGISGRIILGQQLELSIGWAYQDVDARHRASGTVNQTRSLELESGSQARMGIAWRVHSGGRVALTIQRGHYQQLEFGFSRAFR